MSFYSKINKIVTNPWPVGVIVSDIGKNGFSIRLPGAETGFFARSRE